MRCPFLIVHGGRDHLFGLDEVQRMADEIRGSALVVYPEGDHALCNEHRHSGGLYAARGSGSCSSRNCFDG